MPFDNIEMEMFGLAILLPAIAVAWALGRERRLRAT